MATRYFKRTHEYILTDSRYIILGLAPITWTVPKESLVGCDEVVLRSSSSTTASQFDNNLTTPQNPITSDANRTNLLTQ